MEVFSLCVSFCRVCGHAHTHARAHTHTHIHNIPLSRPLSRLPLAHYLPRQRQTDACIARRAFHYHAATLGAAREHAARFGVLDHPQRRSVFDRPTRILILRLAVDVASCRLARPAQPQKPRVADGLLKRSQAVEPRAPLLSVYASCSVYAPGVVLDGERPGRAKRGRAGIAAALSENSYGCTRRRRVRARSEKVETA